jgi:HAE1 family hydrophobic/amphiphilic exporter-1/multidrug efflux pump
MSRFFINRPIFAWVIAVILMLAGGLALRSMSVAQFPAIAPPMVQIATTLPGSDARTLEQTTTQVIEQQMKGSTTSNISARPATARATWRSS